MRKVESYFLFTLFVLGGFCSFTQSAQAEPFTIPYTGRLEHDGALVTTMAEGLQMAFFVLRTQEQEIPNDPLMWPLLLMPAQNPEAWYELHQNVQVHQGKFSVELGMDTPFVDGFFSEAGFVFIGVMINVGDPQQGEAQWVELGGPNNRQKILASPRAITAQEAQDFHVHGDLEVDGSVTTLNRLFVRRGIKNLFVAEDRITANSELTLQSGNGQDVRVGRDLVVDRDLTVTRNLTVNGTISGGFDLDTTSKRSGVVYVRNERNVIVEYGYLTTVRDGDRIVVAIRSSVGDPPDDPDEVVLGQASNSFCFLTKVLSGSDNNTDITGCEIALEDGNWYLRSVNELGDGFAKCQARCVTW